MKRAIWVSLFVLFIYFITYAGIPHSIDELATVALTDSLLHNSVNVNRMEWEQERYPPQNAYGLDGNLYSKKGLGTAVLILPLFLLGKYWSAAGSVQLAFLTGAFIIATAVFVFYWLADALGYSRKIATLGALALGLGTILWPYAQMLFSEPLAALGVALALLGLVRWWSELRWPWLLLCGVGGAVVILSRSANALLVLPFALAVASRLIAAWFKQRNFAWLVQQGLAYGLPLVVVVGWLVVYNYGRFQTLLTFPTVAGEAFTTPLWIGISGQLWSSGKGLVFYVPLVLMIPLSYFADGRKMRSAPYLVALFVVLIPLVFYGRWYDWPGGKAWGPRFLVPTMPALVMLCLPAFNWLSVLGRKWRVWLLYGWLLLTCAMQLPGVLVNFEYQENLDGKAGATYQDLLWNWDYSPLLTYWDKLFTGAANPVVFHPFFWENSQKMLLLLGALFVIIIALDIWRAVSGEQSNSQLTVLGAVTVCFGVTMVLAAREDPRWWEATGNIAANREVRALVQQTASDGDLVLLDLQENYDRPGRIWEWNNEARLNPDYLGFKRKPELGAAEMARLEQWLSPYGRVWLVMQATAVDDPASTTESWLSDWGYEGQSQWIDTQRVVEFLTPFAGDSVTETAVFQTNPPLTLHYQRTLDPSGQYVLLDLQWVGEAEASGLKYSVQEWGSEQGQIVQQLDRLIEINQLQKAGLYLAAPDAQLILRIYDPATGTIYPAQIDDGTQVDFLTLND